MGLSGLWQGQRCHTSYRYGAVMSMIFPTSCRLAKKSSGSISRKYPQATANAIQKFIDNPNLHEEMGENGRKRVLDLYYWNDNVSKMINIYNITLDILSFYYPPKYLLNNSPKIFLNEGQKYKTSDCNRCEAADYQGGSRVT